MDNEMNDAMPFRSDPHWRAILNELKTDANWFGHTLQGFLFALPQNTDKSIVGEYEKLCCEIEDAFELARDQKNQVSTLRNVRVTQAVEDFAEAYTQRFGSKSAAGILLLVDDNLPEIKTYPDRLLYVIACIVRAAHKRQARGEIEVTVRAKPSIRILNRKSCAVIISCKNIGFIVGTNGVLELLEEFKKGIYLPCVREFGLELCAAFHIVSQMGGVIHAKAEHLNTTEIEIELLFEQCSRPSKVSNMPKLFYVCTQSEALKKNMVSLASFHGIKATLVSTPTEVPSTGRLVYDATQLKVSDLTELSQLPHPSETTLILPSSDVDILKAVAAMGFRHFVTLPLVSTKLIRSVAGLNAYVIPRESAQASQSKKLRILVVDDAATARIVLRDHFESEGHTVIEAADGVDFVRYIQAGEKFDIIFCDLTMCHIDGPTAVEMVREHEKKSGGHTPIVLMTAYEAIDDQDEIQKADFARILRKPVQGAELNEILNKICGGGEPTEDRLLSDTPVTQIIDLEDLRQRCSGKTKTMVRVLEAFLEISHSHVAKLRSPGVRDDLAELVKTVHTIKGLLKDIGAKIGAQSLAEIEQKLKNSKNLDMRDLDAIEELVDAACNRASVLKEDLKVGHV